MFRLQIKLDWINRVAWLSREEGPRCPNFFALVARRLSAEGCFLAALPPHLIHRATEPGSNRGFIRVGLSKLSKPVSHSSVQSKHRFNRGLEGLRSQRN